MSRFLFITDLHLQSSSVSRTGDPLQDCIDKLRWVVSKANADSSILLIGGDVFDRASPSYEVFNAFVDVLLGATVPVYAIKGNHDMLFMSDANDRKCALSALYKSGLLISLDGKTVDLGDCVLTNELPLVTRSKPQVAMFHGFLNTPDDKRFTVKVQDLMCGSDSVVLLGHDHADYGVTVLSESVSVVRPGSLFRNKRDVSSDRVPCIVRVEVSNGRVFVSREDVPCRPWSEVMRESKVRVSDSDSDVDYQGLIEQLRSSQSTCRSFMDIVRSVTTDDISAYIEGILSESKLNSKSF